MKAHAASRRFAWAAGLGCTAAIGALAAGWFALQTTVGTQPLLLAPMINVMQGCIERPQPSLTTALPDGPVVQTCRREGGSAAALVESTLQRLGPQRSPDGRYELGYTLQVPLLQLFKRTGAAGLAADSQPIAADHGSSSDWVIDRDAVTRLVHTLADDPRPAIVYLFSTHFGIGAPIEAALAADPANLAVTARGPLARDRYYGLDIHPWSVARIDNGIAQRRLQAIDAVVGAICRLPSEAREKIRALTLLGEVHQLFPDFEAGMGFASPYLVSDYSTASVRAFRGFLRQRFGGIAALNRFLGQSADVAYRSFDDVDPPSRDIRTDRLQRFVEHIDSFAQGTLPIAGWAAPAADGRPRRVQLLLDGEPLAQVTAHLGRQDVLAARPEIGRADVGWRHDLDFRQLPVGVHRIDLLLLPPDGTNALPLHVGTRRISIMGRDQTTPPELPMKAELPPHVVGPLPPDFWIDLPADRTAYWFNPLVPLWHAFRNDQVVRYLDRFDRRVADSCLWDTPRYVHQILPFTNPGWDANKFAVDASLHAAGGIQLGVSLYGEAARGEGLFPLLAQWQKTRYGVTEFHPLKAVPAAQLQDVLQRHRAHGAQFVSFFLEPYAGSESIENPQNLFSFDPSNPKFGSDRLFESVQALMNGKAP